MLSKKELCLHLTQNFKGHRRTYMKEALLQKTGSQITETIKCRTEMAIKVLNKPSQLMQTHVYLIHVA